jgi:hypothetical protein
MTSSRSSLCGRSLTRKSFFAEPSPDELLGRSARCAPPIDRLHPSQTPRKMYADVAEPPAPLILLFYQVEIRLIQFLHRNSSTHSQLPMRRDSTTRLWQLQGCYVEIAGLPAALGMTTLYSMRAYRPLSTLLGHSRSDTERLFLPCKLASTGGADRHWQLTSASPRLLGPHPPSRKTWEYS